MIGSKPLIFIVLALFTPFCTVEGFAQAAGQEQSEYQKAFQAGKKLYEDGEHKEAVIRFLQALNSAKEKTEIADACFYLSLSYYGLGDAENTTVYIKKAFEAQPEREINARLFPSGYVVQYYRIKSDFAGQKPAQVEEKPTAVPGKAAAEPQVKKKGKFPWLIVGGLVVAAGVVLYLVLNKKKDTGSNMGAISIVSTPSGAKVFLDVNDTGQTTACTLNNVSVGSHAVKLTKDGYADYQQNVTVTGGQTAAINASMTANIIVVTSPASNSAWLIGTTNDIRWQVDSAAMAAVLKTKLTSRRRENLGERPGQSEILPKPAEGAARDSRSGFVGGIPDQRLPLSPESPLQISSSQAIVKLRIDLYKGGTLHSLIIAETDNTGVYSWPVSQPTVSGADYKIRISCSTDSSVYGESAAFTITAGTILISAPASGSVWIRGSAYDIQWTSTASGNVKIELFKGTAAVQTIAASAPNNGLFNWTVPGGLADGADYMIRISLVSNPTVFGESGRFTVFAGSIVVSEPGAGAKWILGTTHDIGWTSTAAGNVKIELYAGSSSVLAISENTANDGIESWTIPSTLSPNTNYKIKISLVSNPNTFGVSGPFQIESGSAYEFVTKWGSLGSGDGMFKQPLGIAMDSGGNIYVTDQGNFRVQKFTSEGIFLLKWGSYGSGDGLFEQPQGIAVDDPGWVFVSNNSPSEAYHNVQKFTSGGSFVARFDFGEGSGTPSHPGYLATDRAGNFYVSSMSANRVDKFTTGGFHITGWGTLGTGDGEFNWPQGIAVDNSGNVYVADGRNHRVQKFTSTGEFLAKWGSEGTGNGEFQTPQGIAVDQAGNVYVVEMENRVQKFTAAGTFITSWGSYGSGNGQFAHPTAVAVDRSGDVYIVDSDNQRVQKFRPVSSAATPPNPVLRLVPSPTPKGDIQRRKKR